jgi:NIMA-interacting peptidyl-prolyl cis-trans isomerase 1
MLHEGARKVTASAGTPSDQPVARSKRPTGGSRNGHAATPRWGVIGVVFVFGALGVFALVRTSGKSAPALAPASSAPSVAPHSSVSLSPSATASDNEQVISVMHLVVTHGDSVMGQSLGISRSKAAAKQRAEEALARARKGEDFGQLVVEYSEEPQAQQSKGQLGNFTRRDAIPSFADAAFQLKVGEISPIVDTPFGYMVILRTK